MDVHFRTVDSDGKLGHELSVTTIIFMFLQVYPIRSKENFGGSILLNALLGQKTVLFTFYGITIHYFWAASSPAFW